MMIANCLKWKCSRNGPRRAAFNRIGRGSEDHGDHDISFWRQTGDCLVSEARREVLRRSWAGGRMGGGCLMAVSDGGLARLCCDWREGERVMGWDGME